MKMLTFIKVKTPSKSIRGTVRTRYLAERERDPDREEPESQPLFTHDRDGVGFRVSDRHLAGGERPKALTNELQHIIIAFNSHDARELQKLKIALGNAAAPDKNTRRGESSKVELSDESANLEHSPDGDEVQSRGD